MKQGREVVIQLVVFSDCTALVPIGLFDLLRKADDLSAMMSGPHPRNRLRVSLVSCTQHRLVTGAGGLRVECDSTLSDTFGDVIVIPALDPDVVDHLATNESIVPWIKRAYKGGSDLASVCTGAFVLAEAGVLDGKSATTHWAFQALFTERYRNVTVVPQAIVVDEGRVVTSGGATSFVNLALFLVERWLGVEVARAASRMFLIDPNKAPQSAYAVFSSQKTHGDQAIVRAQQRIEASVAQPLGVDDLAKSVALSRRTFARRFLSATGNTPLEYIQRVRVEAAKRALEGNQSVADVALAVGYQDPVAFRKVFVRVTGLTPTDYRVRYGSPQTANGDY